MDHLIIDHAKLGKINFAALPSATQRKFVISGINHVFGNEVSSKVNSHFKKLHREAAIKAASADGALTDEAKKKLLADLPPVVIDTESEAYAKVFDDELQAKHKAALDGTLGETRVSTRDPFEDRCLSIARGEVVAMLRKGGFWTAKKEPSMDESWKMGNAEYSFEDLILRRRNGVANVKDKDRIEREAKAFLAAKAKKAEAIENAALEF